MKARFTGSQKEFDAFYQRLRAEQPTNDTPIDFIFDVDQPMALLQETEQLSFSEDGNFVDDGPLDENDIFHPKNREWLLGQLAIADEDIKAGRVVPANKALFKGVIERGKARLKAGEKLVLIQSHLPVKRLET